MGRGIWGASPAEASAPAAPAGQQPAAASSRRETPGAGNFSSRLAHFEGSESRPSSHGSSSSESRSQGRSADATRERNRGSPTGESQGSRRPESGSRTPVPREGRPSGDERQRGSSRRVEGAAQANAGSRQQSSPAFVRGGLVTTSGDENKMEVGITLSRGEGEAVVGNGRQRSSSGSRRGLHAVMPGPAWWQDAYQVDWRPKKFIAKFRQQTEFVRFGANCEFSRSDAVQKTDRSQSEHSLSVCGFEVASASFKFVLKPSNEHHNWKLLYEPQRQDIRFLSGKIPLSSFLTFQIGVGHDFANHTTGLRWKIGSAWGGPAAPTSLAVRRKTSLPICPGLDARAGWSAEFNLPHLHGSVGMGDPVVGVNVGRVSASVDRIEAIFTSMC